MEFDRLLLKEDYINPVRYLATKHIRPTKENGAVIAPFFEDLTAETVQKALKGMIMYHKLLLAPGAVKRKILFVCRGSSAGGGIDHPLPESFV